jgi:hypothetical protein
MANPVFGKALSCVAALAWARNVERLVQTADLAAALHRAAD